MDPTYSRVVSPRQGRASQESVAKATLWVMTDDYTPTLADDEATLHRYAMTFVDQFESVAQAWFGQLVDRHAPGHSADPEVRAALDQAAAEVVQQLRALLGVDITDQPVGPLEIIRRSVRVPTDVLRQVGATPVPRDDFAIQNFPDDEYALTPASFADIDPSLHEPGLVWGAAKAHVHLRRRREA